MGVDCGRVAPSPTLTEGKPMRSARKSASYVIAVAGVIGLSFFAALASGPDEAVSAAAAPQELMVYTGHDTLMPAIRNTENLTADGPTEEMTFTCSSMEWTYTDYDASGKAQGRDPQPVEPSDEQIAQCTGYDGKQSVDLQECSGGGRISRTDC